MNYYVDYESSSEGGESNVRVFANLLHKTKHPEGREDRRDVESGRVCLEALFTVYEGSGRIELFIEDGDVTGEAGFDFAVIIEAE
ncbi:hypothetical protein [Rubritalea tangerina]|uniref:hypothetical protein n=1 Tax=Rubritalea tangerina TaxID=430798 RepID=UPI0036099333